MTALIYLGAVVLAINIGALAFGWWRPQTYKNIFVPAPAAHLRRPPSSREA